MSDKYYVGADLITSNNNGKYKPVSRVTLVVDDDNVITAGDDTGFELTANCPHATQQMADALLRNLRDYVYQAFEADEANLNPSAELGDGVTAGGLYGVISKIRDDGSGYVGISAPGTAELEDEYPMDGPLSRMVNRQLAGVRSSITKTAEQIRMEVIGEIVDENGNPISVASAITQTADSISTAVSTAKTEIENDIATTLESYSTITQTADSISTAVSTAKTEIENGIATTLESYSTITQMADSISAAVEGLVDGESVNSSIEAALSGITLEASSAAGSSTFTIKSGGVEIATTELNLTVDAANISGNVQLGGLLSVYTNGYRNQVGGYLGYDTGFYGGTGGIGIRSQNEYSQLVCTDGAARLSYTDDDGLHLTQVVCGQDLALSSVKTIHFSIGGDVSSAVAGINSKSLYPASAKMTLGTSDLPWADVYAGDTSMLDLLERVEAIEAALEEAAKT